MKEHVLSFSAGPESSADGAHHPPGSGCALFLPAVAADAKTGAGASGVCVISCGADGRAVLRDAKTLAELASESVGEVAHTAAIHPSGTQAVVCNERYAKVLKLPALEVDNEPGRSSLPIRALACSPDGKHWVLGGDHGVLKMYNFKDQSSTPVRQFQCDGYITGLAWDPAGEYLAGVQADGILLVWEARNSKVQCKRRVLRKVSQLSPLPCGISWNPDGGSQLAVPGTDNDVVLYERLAWAPSEGSDHLTGGHAAPVTCVAYSPNGLYIASGDEGGGVCVWDAFTRKLVAKAKGDVAAAPGQAAGGGPAAQFPGYVVSLSWHPQGNALLVMNASGKMSLWPSCVPGSRPGPALPAEEAAAAAAAPPPPAARLVDDVAADADEEEGGAAGPGADEDEEDAESLDDFIVNDMGGAKPAQQAARAAPPARAPSATTASWAAAPARELPCQRAFQPCSTPASDKASNFLSYTRTGCLTSRAMDDGRIVEVTFHDTQRLLALGGRVAPITDYFNCTLGCLGEHGVLLASPARAGQASMLLYRPLESWAPQADWQCGLPLGESVTCIAAGASFTAAATSARLLRLFSPAGLQLGILALQGPAVAMAAQGHSLAVVTVQGPPSPSMGTQNLWINVYDIATSSCTLSCACPLTPSAAAAAAAAAHQGSKPAASASGSSVGAPAGPHAPATALTWLGFSDKGAVAVADSAGAVFLRTSMWGGSWVPVFQQQDHVKAGERYWPVALHGSELLTIMLPPPLEHPQVEPAPYLTPLALRQPSLHKGDPAEEGLERDLLMSTLMLEQARSSCDEAGGGGVVHGGLVAAAERGVDTAALKLLQAALKAGRHARAYDACACLNMPQSLEGALRLANHHRATALAERVAALAQMRAEEDALAVDQAYVGSAALAGAVTPIPMKAAAQMQQMQMLANGGQAPDSAGPSTGGGAGTGGLTALKRAAVAAPSPIAMHQDQENVQVAGAAGKAQQGGNLLKRKTGGAAAGGGGGGSQPLQAGNNPFARKPKQAKA